MYICVLGKQIIDNRIGFSFLFHSDIPIILVKIAEEWQKPSSVEVGSMGLGAKIVMLSSCVYL